MLNKANIACVRKPRWHYLLPSSPFTCTSIAQLHYSVSLFAVYLLIWLREITREITVAKCTTVLWRLACTVVWWGVSAAGKRKMAKICWSGPGWQTQWKRVIKQSATKITQFNCRPSAALTTWRLETTEKTRTTKNGNFTKK